MKSVLAATAVLSAALLGAGCVVVDSQGHIVREEKRFTVSGAPDLQLSTFDGSIRIKPGSDREIVVEIEKRGPTPQELDKLEVQTKQDGNHVEVTVKKPRTETFFGIHMSPTANLIVTMPAAGNVVARSGDGSIRIERVSGRLELRTGDGSIRGNNLAGDITVQTGDGSVALDALTGKLDVETSDGSVTVAGKPDTLKLHTGDGSVTLRAEAGTQMNDDWSITTGDGGISVYLPRDFAAELDASTGDGSIHSELDVAGAGNSSSHDRHALRGRIGNGGKLLRIRTGDGSVRLRES